jgi:hypothetical protein
MRDQTGRLRAVMLCSAVLDDHLWLIFDRDFEPNDGLAIYYPGELAELKAKTPEQLRTIFNVRRAFIKGPIPGKPGEWRYGPTRVKR